MLKNEVSNKASIHEFSQAGFFVRVKEYEKMKE